MTHKVLSPKATLHLFDMLKEGTPPPPKITEHKERMEAATAAADRRHRPDDTIDQDEMKCLLNMKMALDTLCGDWAEGTERIRWLDIPEQVDVAPEDVMRECVMSTESHFGNMGVEVLAAYLDACGYDRLLFRLGEACVLRVREYLKDVVPEPVYNAAILDKPAEHYDTTDQDVLRDKLVNRFILFVNDRSPQHLIRAMVANIEWGIGNAVRAIDEAGFAYCEATVEQFGVKLQMGHPDVNKAFESFELWKAKQLLKFLK
ncbi:MAG: hypothetical protein ACI9BF_000548 [Candidatus Paceibacteria bacterium]|jgi:hypothetical protein